MTIEEEVARALADAVRESARIEDWAAALSPLLNRVRAEVQVEVLVKVAENAEELQHTREEVRERIYSGYSVDWSDGYDAACGDIAEWARQFIEQNSEGSGA